jgi:hypothetical protein
MLSSILGGTFLMACNLDYIVDTYFNNDSNPYFLYQLQETDTLPAIATWYTGSADNWKFIYKLNKQHQNELKAGNYIFIPNDMLVTKDPMPRNLVSPANVAAEQVKPKQQTVVQTQAQTSSSSSSPRSKVINNKINPVVTSPSKKSSSQATINIRTTKDDAKIREKLLKELLAD